MSRDLPNLGWYTSNQAQSTTTPVFMVGWCGSSSCLQFLRQRKLRVPATSDSFAVWILEIHDETRTFVSMFVEAHVGGKKEGIVRSSAIIEGS